MKPLKWLLCAALVLCVGVADAQQQICWTVSEPAVACDGRDGVGHGTVYSVPPAWFPFPAQIIRVNVWYLGAYPSMDGSVGLALDPGSAFVTFSHYPATQAGTAPGEAMLQRIITLGSLATRDLQPAAGTWYFTPPILWSPGDSIYSGYACAGGSAIQMGWSICAIKP